MVTGDRKIKHGAGRRSPLDFDALGGARQNIITAAVRCRLFLPITIYLSPVTSE